MAQWEGVLGGELGYVYVRNKVSLNCRLAYPGLAWPGLHCGRAGSLRPGLHEAAAPLLLESVSK